MRRLAQSKRPGAVTGGRYRAVAVLCAATLLFSLPVMAQELTERFERLLVGALIGEREADVMEVLREGDFFYVPLQPFLRLCGCELAPTDGAPLVVTPLGARPLDSNLVVELEEGKFVHELYLRRELAINVEFIPAQYAVRFFFPWSPGERLNEALNDDLTRAAAEALPPELSISTLRLDGSYTKRPTATNSQLAALALGRVAGGRWRLRGEQSLSGASRIQEYAWTRTFGNSLVLAGHQRLDLHPILSPLELTGVQGAWTNQPLEMFATSGQPGELLPRSLNAGRTVEGRGPAAGVAELRVDGRSLARRTISLDGVYEFLDVMLPRSQSARVEVFVYDRFDLSSPLEVHDHTRGVADAMLPAGARLIMGGAGASGNRLGELLGESVTMPGTSAFIQSRVGLTDRITGEATVQTEGGHTQAMLGLVGSVGRHFAGTVGFATAGGSLAWDFDVQGHFARWNVTARSQRRSEGFSSPLSVDQQEHYGEVMFRASDDLDVSMIGSSRRGALGNVDFVLPAVSWQPTERTWLRARPDFDGRYRADFSWALDAGSRLTASYYDRSAMVGFSKRLTRSIQTTVTAQWHPELLDRENVQVSWLGEGPMRPGLTAAVRRTRGQIGAMVGAQAVVGPGLLVSAQFENDPHYGDALNRRDNRVTLRLHTDMAFARGRVLSGSTYALSATRGAIGGTLKVSAGATIAAADLAGLPILVDGRAVARTQRGGRFFIGGLRPGVYNVEIEPEGLPIELTLEDGSRRAEVASGGVTTVEFLATVEYGFAGRVMVESDIFPDALVELLDARGNLVQSTRTDRFGLYRFDGVPRGTYTVRLSAKNAPLADVIWPNRTVHVEDFMFGQDLLLRSIDIREQSMPEGLTGGSATGETGGQGSGQQDEQQ